MKNEVTTNNDYTESLFESIKHINDFGQEFWYARKLQEALEYKRLAIRSEMKRHNKLLAISARNAGVSTPDKSIKELEKEQKKSLV